MWYRKMTMLAGVLLALVVAGTGVGLIVRQAWASAGPDNPQAAQADAPPQNPKAAPPAGGQGVVPPDKAGGQERIADVRLGSMLNTLDAPMDCKDFLNPMSLKEFMGLMYEKLLARRQDLPILVDTAAFTADDPDRFPEPESVYNSQIKPLVQAEMKNIKLSTAMLLRLALAHLPGRQATYLVRRDHILITTTTGAHPERLSAPPARFEKRPLAAALEELAEMTGATILVDGRAADKAKTPITAAFRGPTTAAAAVQLLAESADLTVVVIDNVLFVTTREHAQRLREQVEKKGG